MLYFRHPVHIIYVVLSFFYFCINDKNLNIFVSRSIHVSL